MEVNLLEFGVTTVVLLVTIVCLYYYYLTKHYGYLEAQGVPVSKPQFVYGTLDLQKPMWQTEWEEYKKFGRFHGVYNGRMPGLMTGDPELLRQLFVKDFTTFPQMRLMPWPKSPAQKYWYGMLFVTRGERWKNTRISMSPTFTTGKLKLMSKLMKECCIPMVEILTKKAEKNEYLEIHRFFMDFALDVTASVAFGTKLDSMMNPNTAFAKATFSVFGPKFSKVESILRWVFSYLLHLIPHTWLGREDPLIYLTNVIKEVLKQRNWKPQGRGDFVDLMLETKIETEEEQNGHTTDVPQEKNRKKVLDEESIISQALLFLIGGVETVAVTLGWSFYTLALHPEIQEKLADEVNRVLDDNGGEVTYEAVGKMSYLDMFISEVLRKYPTGTRSERECAVDNVEFNGVKLMKGMIIGIPIYAIHHDPDFYPDPEKFDPERFSPENKQKRDPLNYIPFGAGPRMCIGNRFALTEVRMVIATVLRSFRLKRCPKTAVPPVYAISMFGMLQAENLTVGIEKRH